MRNLLIDLRMRGHNVKDEDLPKILHHLHDKGILTEIVEEDASDPPFIDQENDATPVPPFPPEKAQRMLGSVLEKVRECERRSLGSN